MIAPPSLWALRASAEPKRIKDAEEFEVGRRPRPVDVDEAFVEVRNPHVLELRVENVYRLAVTLRRPIAIFEDVPPDELYTSGASCLRTYGVRMGDVGTPSRTRGS